MVKSDHGVRVPQHTYFRPTLSTDVVQRVLWWDMQRGALVEKGQGPMAEK